MRRQSSQVSASGMASQPSLSLEDESAATTTASPEPSSTETVYGDQAQDAGDEVRFSVELTRLDRLNDTFSLDIRRLKGNLRSYKFLYDTLREYVIVAFFVSFLNPNTFLLGEPTCSDRRNAVIKRYLYSSSNPPHPLLILLSAFTS